MRTIDSSILVLKPSNFAWWHRSWTGRFVLAALLIAAAAFALMPDRTSAQDGTLDPDVVCQTYDNPNEVDNGGRIADQDPDTELISDCKALVKAANALQTTSTGSVYGWIRGQIPETYDIDQNNDWEGVTVELVDHDGDPDTDMVMRVTAVELSDELLTGTLTDDWADLTALTSLDLSDNNLEGTVPRSVWAFFDDNLADAANLMLDGNKDLKPSPALGLSAVVSKIAADQTDAGKTMVTLSFDNIWYTTEVASHEYRYSADGEDSWGPNDAEDSDGWMSMDTGCDPPCGKLDGDDARVRIPITSTPTEDVDTYIYQVRAVKTDLGADTAVTTDDTVMRSEISRIDVVGPQTLTAESMYTLPVAVAYTSATSGDDTVLDNPEVDGSDADNIKLNFNPLAEGETTVDLAQADGSHTFPVKVLSADSAPPSTRIPNREVVNQRRDTSLDLTRYFDGDNLTYTATSSRTNIATVKADGSELLITTLREGRTDITVTATDPDTRGSVTRTFRVTVVSPNNAPQLIGNIPDLTLYLDDAGTQVDMTPYFRDQDNEFLRFIPQSSNPMVVTATSVGRNVIFNVNGLGEITMTIIAQDGAGATAFGSFKVTVLDPNAAPQAVGVIPPQTIRVGDEGLALSLGSYFTDANNDPLTYRAVSADTSILTVEVTEAVVTLTAVVVGETTVTVTATDTGGKSATQTIVVVVLPANKPPEVTGQIPDQTLQYNDEPLGLDVTMYFTDPDGDVLSYIGEGTDEAVAEVRVHSDGLVRIDPISHGEIEVTVTARDPLGASVSQSFMVMVQGNLPPEAEGVIDDQVLLEGGRAVTINVSGYFSDPNGDELTYMATSSNADAVQAVVIDGSSELVLRPLAPAEDVTVTVTAMDPEGETAAQLVMVTVAAAAPPATATPAPTATPEPTAPPPPPTATPAPTATFVPTDGGGGFPVGLVIVLLLVLAGVAAAVFIIQRRR